MQQKEQRRQTPDPHTVRNTRVRIQEAEPVSVADRDRRALELQSPDDLRRAGRKKAVRRRDPPRFESTSTEVTSRELNFYATHRGTQIP